MYLNAFKNPRSTFMRESGGQLRGDKAGHKPEDWGWIDVSSIRVAGAELRPGARFIQPDGNDPEDQTVLSVPLPSPVPAGGEITVVYRHPVTDQEIEVTVSPFSSGFGSDPGDVMALDVDPDDPERVALAGDRVPWVEVG